MISIQLHTEEEFLTFAGQMAHAISAGAIIFLHGPLGVGKTTFVRGFLRALGYTEKVKSPTYTIVEPYEVADKHLYHFDLYRINVPEELEYIGIEDYFSSAAICLIEWPEKGFPILPQADIVCDIAFANEEREIKIEALTNRGERILQETLLEKNK